MAADGRRHIVAFGGLPGDAVDFAPFAGYLTALTGRTAPRTCLLSTAAGDDPAAVARSAARFEESGLAARHLALFPMPSEPDPEDFLLSQDLIFVGGGSVANMLAVWRVHGLDAVLRKAWEAGIVLSGVSAGAICWFEGGTTDSFGPQLRAFTGGLGLLHGSYCPHYDSEARRRPLFTSLIADGVLPPGIACEDGAGAHLVDRGFDAVVSTRPDARGYRVEPDGAGGCVHTLLPSRLLPGEHG